jgi:iron-sulfur cluster assembly accessory protein
MAFSLRAGATRAGLLPRLMASAAVRQRGPTFLQPLKPLARRTMSMVTKTKVSELPMNEMISDHDNGAPSTEQSSSFSIPPPLDAGVVMKDVLIVTPSCMERVEKLVSLKDVPSYLRVYVDAGGCSGFSYKFEVDSEALQADDIVVHQVGDSPRVVVDEASLEFLKGSKIDYVQEMIKSAFVVAENPQSESACGCGSSFAVKNFSNNSAAD